MKNRLTLLVISVLFVCSLKAQTDTVGYPDPFYLYRAMPSPLTIEGNDFRPHVFGDYYLQAFHTDAPVTIYGVACLMDTLDADKEHPDSSYIPMLFRYEGERMEDGLLYRCFSVLDSTTFQGYTRLCKYKLHYVSNHNDNNPGDTVFNCFEFYFQHPFRSDTVNTFPGYQDSIFVGRKVDVSPTFTAWERQKRFYEYVGYAAEGHFYGKNEHANHIGFHGSYSFSNDWGPFFPIVRLRCARLNLRLGRNWYDTTVVIWNTTEAPEGYEISLGEYGSDPDSGTVISLDNTCHRYAFGGLSSDRHYSVWVRKSCRYDYFDTVVWGPWSNPVSFFGPYTPPAPGDTTGIDDVSTYQCVNLTPNPASGTVSVSTDYTMHRIELYNTAGLLVMSTPVSDTRIDLPLDGLLPGTYVVAITTTKGTSRRKLLVK